jgi:photosystem II stability/assembly factor-like uncharacterized protein
MRVVLYGLAFLSGGLGWLPAAAGQEEALPIYAGTESSVYRTIDGGATWTPAGGGLPGASIFALVVDPVRPGTVYAGTIGRGVYKTMDGGLSWAPMNTGLTDSAILTLAMDLRNPNVLYAGTAGPAFFPGKGVFKSTNGGQSWAVANTGLPVAIIKSLKLNPRRGATVYAGTNGAGVYRSRNGGESWEAANTGCAPASIDDILVSPADPSVLYAGLSGCSFRCLHAAGVCKSTNGGRRWEMTNEGLPDLQVLTLALEPGNPDVLYAGTRLLGLFGSRDGGAMWNLLDPSMAPSLVWTTHFALLVDARRPGTVYAGTANGVYRSEDRGATWEARNGGLPPETRVLALAMPEPACTPVELSPAWAEPPMLWPADGRMVDVQVKYRAESSCEVRCGLRVSSDEPDRPGTAADWMVVDAHHVKLRAERWGDGRGRTYSIAIACTNDAGLSASEVVTVRVPHGRR